MKMTTLLLVVPILLASSLPARSDGLIQSLPPDGSWVAFEATGEANDSRGNVSVKQSGTLTLKSVGREVVEGEPCRWIEIDMNLKFERQDRNGEQSDLFKLLIPEKKLAVSEDPRLHVVKAWHRIGTSAPRQLDLKGEDARLVAGLDEVFHAPFTPVGTPTKAELKTPAGAYPCLLREDRDETQMGEVRTTVTTKTWQNDQVPFGLAAYRNQKARSANEKARGGRWIELKVSRAGADAKSAIAQ